MPLRDLIVRVTEWFVPARDLDAPVVEEVLTRHAGSLMRLKGVMSVGVGRTADGRPAIFLGIDNPHAASVSDLPSTIDGVPVVYRQVGRPEARAARPPEIEQAERTARRVARRDFSERFAEEFPDATAHDAGADTASGGASPDAAAPAPDPDADGAPSVLDDLEEPPA